MDTNRVVISGRLTKDPEMVGSTNSICKLRVALTTRQKRDGEWTDKSNYFDVTVFGQQGENCSKYLSKGRGIIVDGRLEWREWDAQDGSKRQSVGIIAESVQFLNDGQGGAPRQAESETPIDTSSYGDFAAATTSAAAPAADDDIPF